MPTLAFFLYSHCTVIQQYPQCTKCTDLQSPEDDVWEFVFTSSKNLFKSHLPNSFKEEYSRISLVIKKIRNNSISTGQVRLTCINASINTVVLPLLRM